MYNEIDDDDDLYCIDCGTDTLNTDEYNKCQVCSAMVCDNCWKYHECDEEESDK